MHGGLAMLAVQGCLNDYCLKDYSCVFQDISLYMFCSGFRLGLDGFGVPVLLPKRF